MTGPTYRVTDRTTGIDYETPRGHRRVESGETADDIPVGSVAWLLQQGLIEEVIERARVIDIAEFDDDVEG